MIDESSDTTLLRDTVRSIVAPYGFDYFATAPRNGESPTELWKDRDGYFVEWAGSRGLTTGRAHRLAAAHEAGNVCVNGWGAADPAVPFGGCKSSGWGRESRSSALGEYLRTKSIYINIA